MEKIYDQMNEAWQAMKSMLEKQNDYLKDRGHESADLTEKIEKINTKIDELETKVSRPNLTVKTDEVSDGVKAFREYLSKGEVPESLKTALMGSSEPAAGYLAPPEFVAKIATYLTLASPIRSVATVYNTNSRRLQIPVQTANAAAAATAEGSANTEDTAMTFAVVNVNTFNIVVNRGVTTEMLYSSAINLEDHLVREFGKAIAKTEGTMFVSGNGSTQPEGIMTNASITYAASGDADEVTAAGIIKAFYKLPEDYARNATWAMRRTTLGKIRTFTDGSGNYLWQPALGELSPPTLLGRPYIECPDMPDEGSGTYPIIVGDFAAGYAIADLNQLEIVRDPYTYATSSIIRFIARRLTGGAVVLPEAFVKVKCATS